MADVYRIVTSEGHEHDYHGGIERLKEDYPGATITGIRVSNELGEGYYEPYSNAKAQAVRRKELAADAPSAEKTKASDAPAVKAKPSDAPPQVDVVVSEQPAAKKGDAAVEVKAPA